MSGFDLCACGWAEYEHDPAEHQPNHSQTSLLDDLRDQLAMRLHGELCDMRCDNDERPCWTAWRVEAGLLMGDIRRALCEAWVAGARGGSRGVLPNVELARRNPFIEHGNLCFCAYCRSAAMGGGR